MTAIGKRRIDALSLGDAVELIHGRVRSSSSRVPQFTLLLGAGFSFPLIPTAGGMLADIPWWLFRRDEQRARKRDADELYGARPTVLDELGRFECELWTRIRNARPELVLGGDGLPDRGAPGAISRAYQLLMSPRIAAVLSTPSDRRGYLRDVIRRMGSQINPAHLYLAGILQAQETWDRGAPFTRTIFTTNFDPLLQRSLQLVNKLYFMTDRPDTIEAPAEDDYEAIHLVYTHGSSHRYVLLNTESEIERARVQNAASLSNYLSRTGVIVIGYSGWQDTTMAALEACRNFDGNLYWFDVHGAEAAEEKLAPNVVEFLANHRENAFYVQSTADDALAALHEKLGLGSAPRFVRDPLTPLKEQLSQVRLSERSSRSANSRPGEADSMQDALRRTLHCLEAALLAFDKPELVESRPAADAQVDASIDAAPLPADASNSVVGATAAKRLTEALDARKRGNLREAVELLDLVIDDRSASVGDWTRARSERGSARREIGHPEGAIKDFTAILERADASPEQKAWARLARAETHVEAGDMDAATADFQALIDDSGVPSEQRTWALLGRAKLRRGSGNAAGAIDDYTRLIREPGVPEHQSAWARLYRAETRSEHGDFDGTLADLKVLVDRADTPSAQRAWALLDRAKHRVGRKQWKEALADSDALLALAGTTDHQRDAAGVIAGDAWLELGDFEAAGQRYSKVIESATTPERATQREDALRGRSWARFNRGDFRGQIEDSRTLQSLQPGDTANHLRLAFGLLFSGEEKSAVEVAKRAIGAAEDKHLLVRARHTLETAIERHGDRPSTNVLLHWLEERAHLLDGRR